ncbi:MAG: hypothetical protein HQ454_04945 [Acidimicrobiaceae bacterium]|nr:hypothetical protein [Acidimicrobiaceae bacterium]
MFGNVMQIGAVIPNSDLDRRAMYWSRLRRKVRAEVLQNLTDRRCGTAVVHHYDTAGPDYHIGNHQLLGGTGVHHRVAQHCSNPRTEAVDDACGGSVCNDAR